MSKIHYFDDYEFLSRHQVARQRPDESHLRIMETAKDLLSGCDRAILLDLGGGTNSYLTYLEGNYTKIISDWVARSLLMMRGVEKVVAALPDIPFSDGTVEWASACAVIEHLPPEIYEKSLQEIARVSKRFVALTGPFFQHLESAYLQCDHCRAIYQCEGHFRRYELADLYALQQYFGGLVRLGFIGNPRGLGETRRRYVLKKFRYGLRTMGLANYPKVPFTQCPVCRTEVFHEYETYKARAENSDSNCWLVPLPFSKSKVGEHFVAVFDREAGYL